MQDVADAPQATPDWTWNNPQEAAREFLKSHPEFLLERPSFVFNESGLNDWVTYWPSAWLKRVRA